MNMKFIITKEEMNKLANYLAGRPWREVSNLMSIISTLPRVEDEAKEVSEEDPDESMEGD